MSSTFLPSTWSAAASSCTSRPEGSRSIQTGAFAEHFQSKTRERCIHIFAGLGAGAHGFPAALGELSQTVVANFPLIGQIGFVHEKDCRYFEAGVGDALIEGQSFVY